MRPVAELGGALTLLSRLPGGLMVRGDWPGTPQCVWAYPLVGLIVGGVGAAVLVGSKWIGLPALPASTLAVAATAWATGGLHEDGLADMFDALGGGRTPERRLAIMRDSRIGAHGALALGLAMLLRVGCLSSLPTGPGAIALVLAGVLGRASMLLVIGGCPAARSQGLSAPLEQAPKERLLIGLMLAVGLVLALEGRWAGPVSAAGAIGLAVAARARSRFGGFTGDVLGATEILAECAVLLAIVAI